MEMFIGRDQAVRLDFADQFRPKGSKRDIVGLRQAADGHGSYHFAAAPNRNTAAPADKFRITEISNVETFLRMA